MEIKQEQCVACKNARPISGGCEAYPSGIPYRFSSDLEPHTKVEPDQKGKFTFEPGEPGEIEKLFNNLAKK